jgi:hypothetical protein
MKRTWWMIRTLTALTTAGCLSAGMVQGDDDGVAVERENLQAEGNDGNLIDLGANFDANVAQLGGGMSIRPGLGVEHPSPPGDESPVAASLRALGVARLAEVQRACRPSAEQLGKLRLALEVDIRRCIAEVDGIRRGYAGKTVNMREREGQQQWHRFQQDVQRCRRCLLAPFAERSLFAESLSTVLDEPQMSALSAETAARRSFRWQALVATALLRLDDILALDQRQHDEIERLLLEKEPPLRVEILERQSNEHAEQMLVFHVLAEVDQKALKAAVGEERWKTALTLANQGRSMRSWLEGQGLLEPKRK